MRALRLIVLDVNETLLDMSPLESEFLRVGLPATAVQTWFAATLRDGFAMTIVGEFATFRDLAIANLRVLLRSADADPAQASSIVEGIRELPLHADVASGLRALRAAGVRIATMTNGSTDVTEAALAAPVCSPSSTSASTSAARNVGSLHRRRTCTP